MNILKTLHQENKYQEYFNIFLKNHKKLKAVSNNDLLEINQQFSELIINNKIFDIRLNAEKEINIVTNNQINYYVIKSDNQLKKDIFLIYLCIYYFLTKKVKNKYYLPLDFEFNTKKVALMQLNFETDYNNRFIFIIYPPYLNYYWNSFLIKKILGNYRITKILHGSDSLDIPYMFNDLIIKPKYIKKFIHSFIDTRYICEFYNLENNYVKRKCKIYEFLLDHKIISQDKLDQLEENSDNMGHIYDIFIQIEKMSNELLKYTLYDVLFLRHLLESFPNNDTYNKLIPQFTRLVFLERRGITKYFSKLNKIINSMNNFFIKNLDNMKLIDTYHIYTNYLNIKDMPIHLIEKINYFKNTIENIKKYIIYKNITKNYHVFINNKAEYKQEFPVTLKLDSEFDILNNLIFRFETEINISI